MVHFCSLIGVQLHADMETVSRYDLVGRVAMDCFVIHWLKYQHFAVMYILVVQDEVEGKVNFGI